MLLIGKYLRNGIFKEAYIKNKKGIKILDVKKNFLHLVNYSTPIKKRISINELKKHIYTIPERPNAIPYVTSYYKKDWGFCMSQSQKKKIKR